MVRRAVGILIHTSVKLVTDQRHHQAGGGGILIHTSVKLVTARFPEPISVSAILIHTSVKLVTVSASGTATSAKF